MSPPVAGSAVIARQSSFIRSSGLSLPSGEFSWLKYVEAFDANWYSE